MLNKAILMGRFTRDPELKTTPQGTSVCSFTLAIDRRFSKGEDKKTDFINCVAWRQTADFISTWFKKGNLICVEGSIQTRSWDGNDGQKRYATEVVVSEATFVESKKAQDSSSADSYAESSASSELPGLPGDFSPLDLDGDLPF